MKWFDALIEDSTRAVARRTSRRSLLASLGSVLIGATAVPLLPIARGASAAEKPSEGGEAKASDDPNTCEYWRHCAVDGFLCGCCGGSETICPPGTEMSAITWLGTCHNPADGRDYVVSYNDCCGKSSCGRCMCNRNERDTPLYIPFQSNDYNWCAGSDSDIPYHCTTSRVVSVAK